jgi:hypothetical protein
MRANEYNSAPILSLDSPVSPARTARPQLEVSRELRGRISGGNGQLSEESNAIWTGIKPYVRRTIATNGLITVPLKAFSSPPRRRPSSGSASARGAASSSTPAPLLSVQRLKSPRQLLTSTMTESQKLRSIFPADEEKLDPADASQPPDDSDHQQQQQHQASKRLTARSAEKAMATRPPSTIDEQSTGLSRQYTHGSQTQRLTVPHLPVHLDFASAQAAAAQEGSQLLTPYQPLSSSRSTTSLAVPDASTIFHRFHTWLGSQRFARREHVVEVRRAKRKKEKEAMDREERVRRVVDGKQEERAAMRKARQQQSKQRALLKQAQIGAAKPPTRVWSDGPNSAGSGADSAGTVTETEDSPQTPRQTQSESDTEFEADLAKAVEQVKNDDVTIMKQSAAEPPPCFVPSLFSYPRLQFSNDGSLLSGDVKSVQKFQAHVCEVTSYAELQAAWTVVAEMLAQETRTKDEAVQDRTFAFLLAEHGQTGSAEQATRTLAGMQHLSTVSSMKALGSFSIPGSEDISPLLSTRAIDPRSSAPASHHPESATHGFEDGQVKGSGQRLLDMLRELGLTNIFVLITSSGLANTAPTASSYGGVGSSARSRASRAHHAQKVARIMLEDFARVRRKLDHQQDGGGRTASEVQELRIDTTEKIEEEKRPESSGLATEAPMNPTGSNVIVPRHHNVPAVGVYALLPGASEAVPIPPLLVTRQMIEQHQQQLILHEQIVSGQQQLVSHDSSSHRSLVSTHPDPPVEELQYLTPAEEEILKSEFLSLLSGHAFLKMNSLNLSKEGGKNRPYFFALWQAYLLRLHPPQEKPDVAKLSDAAGLAATALARNRALFSEKELLLQQEISLPTNDGRMAANLQPNARTAQRIAEKIQAFSQGAEGLMLDGFHSDRTPQQRRKRRDPLDPSNGPSTQRAHLQLRRGAGQPGRIGSNASMRPLIVRASITSPTFTPQEQALLDAQQAEAEELEKLSLQQLELARRKTLLHTGGGEAPNASLWLELQRARHISPSHRVQSHAQLYHSLLHVVYAFRAKCFLLKLSRASLIHLADKYPTHPPFLLRILVLSIGILLGWPTLHWRALRHLLRGEVPVTQISSFLSTDQATWRLYLMSQAATPLPPCVLPARLAPTMFAREQMEEKRREFQTVYREAANFSAEQEGVDMSSMEYDLAMQQPRDLLAHLMGMDVNAVTPVQYGQVLTLFTEPGLTPAALAALPDDLQNVATTLYEWILLTLRCYNVCHACHTAFSPMNTAEQTSAVEGYRRYIKNIGKKSSEIEEEQKKRASEEQEWKQQLLEQESKQQEERRRFRTYSKPPVPKQLGRLQASSGSTASSPRSSRPTTPSVPHHRGRSNSTSSSTGSVDSLGSTRQLGFGSTISTGRVSSASRKSPRHHARSPSFAAVVQPAGPPRGLAATLASGNLSTLLSSERPAAGNFDQTMSAWLSSSSSSDAKLFGSHGFRYQMTAGEDYGSTDAPSRRMG